MSASFVVYVDESGGEGFSFGQGSSDWFVLSAVITRAASLAGTSLSVNVLDLRPAGQLRFPPLGKIHVCAT